MYNCEPLTVMRCKRRRSADAAAKTQPQRRRCKHPDADADRRLGWGGSGERWGKGETDGWDGGVGELVWGYPEVNPPNPPDGNHQKNYKK